MPVSQDVIRPLFVTGLRDVHAVEQQALALMNTQVSHLAHYPEVEARLRSHIQETHGQIARVDEMLDRLGESHSAVKDVTMSVSGTLAALGHTFAADEIIKNSFANYAFENFEAASYTGLITMAEAGGFTDAIAGLKQSLGEERAMAEFVIDNLPAITHRFLERRAAGETASH